MKNISTDKRYPLPDWHELEVILPYTPPLDWENMLDYFNNHQIEGTEKITHNSYERIFEIDGVLGFFHIVPQINKPALVLKVWIQDQSLLPVVIARIRRMFDLDLDHTKMLTSLNAQSIFKDIIEVYPALRIARGWDVFEIIVLTILGQVVSVKRAKDLMKQLVRAHGIPVKHPINQETFLLFPSPKQIATANLAQLGTTQTRKRCLQTISAQLLDKSLDFTKEDVDEIKKKLLAIPGIGKWSVEYIALRGIGHEDSFPETDLALKRVIKYHSEFNIETVRPWRSYAAIYLWKDYMMHPEKYKESKS